jgi:hypothetical protein
MGRRKQTDEKTAKPIRGPGRKAKKQGEPTFPKELMQTGKIFIYSKTTFTFLLVNKIFFFRIYWQETIIQS